MELIGCKHPVKTFRKLLPGMPLRLNPQLFLGTSMDSLQLCRSLPNYTLNRSLFGSLFMVSLPSSVRVFSSLKVPFLIQFKHGLLIYFQKNISRGLVFG